MHEVSRREALAAGAGLGLAWTGTKYGGAWLRTGSVRCADLVAPLSDRFQFEYGVVDGFEMSVADEPIAVGDEATFHLRNRTTEVRSSDVKYTYALQQRTGDGWRHVLKIPRNQGWPSSGSPATHEPGDGFTWTVPLTRAGLTRGPYRFCGKFTPGAYRFGYWGVGSEWAIPAVRFDVRDSR